MDVDRSDEEATRAAALVGRLSRVVDLTALDALAASLDELDVDGLPDEPTLAQAAQVRPAIARALAAPVGVALLTAVSALMRRDPEELSEREWLEVTRAWHRLKSHCGGAQLGAIASLATARRDRTQRDVDAGRPDRWGARGSASALGNELAPVLAVAPGTATQMVTLARTAEDALPAALDAVVDAVMTPGQLAVLAAVVTEAPAAVRVAVEAAAVRLAPRRTLAQLRQDLHELAARLDPAHAAKAARAGEADRDVRLGASATPGCKLLSATLPAAHAMAAALALNAAARRATEAGVRADGSPEDRTLGQLRADYLVGALTGLADPTPADLDTLSELQVTTTPDDPTGPSDEGPSDDGPDDGPDDGGPADSTPPADRAAADQRAALRDLLNGWPAPAPVPVPHDLAALCRVAVVVAASTLAGTDDHPASIPGSGPLDADAARTLAAHARFRWLHVDAATGFLLHRHARSHAPPAPEASWGTRRPPAPPPLPSDTTAALRRDGYVPGHLLRAHVEVRDATCIGPACHHPARSTDLDHTEEYRPAGAGGATTAANLGPHCRRAHQSTTHGQWQLRQPSPGSFTWTSPLGLTYRRTARPVLPGWDALGATAA